MGVLHLLYPPLRLLLKKSGAFSFYCWFWGSVNGCCSIENGEFLIIFFLRKLKMESWLGNFVYQKGKEKLTFLRFNF